MTQFFIDTTYIDTYLGDKNSSQKISLETAHKSLQDKTCRGADYLGWIHNESVNASLLENIAYHAAQIIQRNDVLLVCGIGGSYLGARAVIEAL